MAEALFASNVLLWLAVTGLAALVFALLRQVGVLHERISPAGALASGATLEVGAPAPQITVTTWHGEARTVGSADAHGQATLLLFVSPTCPVCKTILPIAESTVAAEGATRLLLASDGPREEHAAFVAAHRLARYGYALSAALGVAYGASKLPYAVLIDAAGIVRARGLVNTREHLESLFEAKARGVASVQDYLQQERAHTDPHAASSVPLESPVMYAPPGGARSKTAR